MVAPRMGPRMEYKYCTEIRSHHPAHCSSIQVSLCNILASSLHCELFSNIGKSKNDARIVDHRCACVPKSQNLHTPRPRDTIATSSL